VKKVRYAIGALGAAPALGFMAVPANAASAATHSAHRAGKTVSLTHVRVAPSINLQLCSISHSPNGKDGIFEGIAYSDTSGVPTGSHCYHETEGLLDKPQTGLVMRTRLYSVHGAKNFSKFVGGSIITNATYFFDQVSLIDHEACEALVSANHHSKVKYGPVCD
jgi:hypothetical protein